MSKTIETVADAIRRGSTVKLKPERVSVVATDEDGCEFRANKVDLAALFAAVVAAILEDVSASHLKSIRED